MAKPVNYESANLQVTERYENGTALSFDITETLFSGKSEFQQLDIYQTTRLGRIMLLDGLVMLTEKNERAYHEMMAHVPLFAHPMPERVLIIGGGDGGTAREVLRHPGVKECVMVEIDGMVVEQSKNFFPDCASEFENPRLDIKIADGIQYIKDHKDSFDVILIDGSDPVGPAVGLFQEEFFRHVFGALKEDGIMASQAESPYLYAEVQKAMFADLRKVFPVVHMYLSFIPFYPSGMWSFAFASRQYGPAEKVRVDDIAAMQDQLQYFNEHVMSGSFALPQFVKNIIG